MFEGPYTLASKCTYQLAGLATRESAYQPNGGLW
jgi:hypothetical protein